MFCLPGSAAHSAARLQKLLAKLGVANPGVRALASCYLHFAEHEPADAAAHALLAQLLTYGPRGADDGVARTFKLVVTPRVGTVSPWSSKATEIARLCGLGALGRLERGIGYEVTGEITDPAALAACLHDRMTESALAGVAGGGGGGGRGFLTPPPPPPPAPACRYCATARLP